MKFKVDEMPYYPGECLFCERDCDNDQYTCQIDGEECVYFKGKDRDTLKCRYLIDDETVQMIANQRSKYENIRPRALRKEIAD